MADRDSNAGKDPDHETVSFSALFAAARNGDENAVGKLMKMYRKYLLLVANEEFDQRLRPKLGPSDVVQESVLHAQQNFAQFAGSTEAELKGWLKSILANDLQKSRRSFVSQKRSVNREVKTDATRSVMSLLVDQQLTPSSDAVQRERLAALADTLE